MDMHTDVLVIGGGVAGCAAALAAARRGADVLMATRSHDTEESNTAHAQGGIVFRAKGDSPELLANDILNAGCYRNYPPAVRHLAENGPPLVQRLLVDEIDVPFDRAPGGDFDITEEAAHSVPRILHAEDLTGRAIILRLLDAVRDEPRIIVRNDLEAVDLLNQCHHGANHLDAYKPPRCIGAYCLNLQTDEVVSVTARETILATGGLGQLYLHTTNPPRARGDGVAMAYRIGARLLNLEYVQFHPTALYHRDANCFLISESMRGEGAVLVDYRGEEFMKRYHELGSLAPRDVVARAIQNEMLQTGRSCVYLDITSKDHDWVRQRFPHIYQTCKRYGIDVATDPIPVVPVAHYSCGGVAVDLLGRTTIPNLRAVGEVSCTGLHGANRLASTSLLEGLLWGWDSGEDAAWSARESTGQGPIPDVRPFVPETGAVDPALLHQDWNTIKYTMWNYVGLTRTPRRLSRALSILRELQFEILSFYQHAKPVDALLGLRNGVTAALAVLFAAQKNHTSCGCHYLTED